MKKTLFSFLFVLALVFSLNSNAFALQCKTGNYGSDECWTTAQLRATGEDFSMLLPGTVMVYDFVTPTQHGLDPNDADRAAFYVRPSASTDNTFVAGVFQGSLNSVSSGDRVQLQVRGKGKLRNSTATVISGDRMFASTLGQARSANQRELGVNAYTTSTSDKVIAFSLTSSTSASTQDAYITIV